MVRPFGPKCVASPDCFMCCVLSVPIDYFPNQAMMLSFTCISPPHAPGTVDVHLYANGTRISDFPVPFDYECPPGTEDPSNPLEDCVLCQPGYFSNSRSGSCEECPVGTYSNTTGAVNCTACPAGTVSITPHATSASVCIPCGLGYYWFNGQCLPCPIGSFTEYAMLPVVWIHANDCNISSPAVKLDNLLASFALLVNIPHQTLVFGATPALPDNVVSLTPSPTPLLALVSLVPLFICGGLILTSFVRLPTQLLYPYPWYD